MKRILTLPALVCTLAFTAGCDEQTSTLTELAPDFAPAAAEAQTARVDSLRSPFSRLLERRDELRLTDAQVTQIEAIAARVEEQNQPLHEQMRTILEAAGLAGINPRDMTPEQRETFRALRDEIRPIREQVRENHQAAMEEVKSVLTAEQQAMVEQWRQERGGQDFRGRRGGRKG